MIRHAFYVLCCVFITKHIVLINPSSFTALLHPGVSVALWTILGINYPNEKIKKKL